MRVYFYNIWKHLIFYMISFRFIIIRY